MRIRAGTLRRLLSEVAIQPSRFAQLGKPVRDPFDKQNVVKAVRGLEGPFRQALELNLITSMADRYNEQTGEFDDAAYEAVKKAVSGAVDKLNAGVDRVVKEAWDGAHAEVQGGAVKPAPQKPAPAQQPQQKGTNVS